MILLHFSKAINTKIIGICIIKYFISTILIYTISFTSLTEMGTLISQVGVDSAVHVL